MEQSDYIANIAQRLAVLERRVVDLQDALNLEVALESHYRQGLEPWPHDPDFNDQDWLDVLPPMPPMPPSPEVTDAQVPDRN